MPANASKHPSGSKPMTERRALLIACKALDDKVQAFAFEAGIAKIDPTMQRFKVEYDNLKEARAILMKRVNEIDASRQTLPAIHREQV